MFIIEIHLLDFHSDKLYFYNHVLCFLPWITRQTLQFLDTRWKNTRRVCRISQGNTAGRSVEYKSLCLMMKPRSFTLFTHLAAGTRETYPGEKQSTRDDLATKQKKVPSNQEYKINLLSITISLCLRHHWFDTF